MPQDEFAWIREWVSRCPIHSSAVKVPVGDDAAVTGVASGQDLVSCIDTMTEGVHFDRLWMTMQEIGWKSIAINLSDLAAMGANFIGAQVSVVVPADVAVQDVSSLYDGMGEILREYHGVLLGGDTVRGSHDFTVTVAALGSIPAGTAVTRAGARPGDRLILTGPTGYSGLIWRSWQQHQPVSSKWREAHTRPRPRLNKGRELRLAGATAMNDISDGLVADVYEIATASGISFAFDATQFDWLSELEKETASGVFLPQELALYGGEDYELVATLPENATVPTGVRIIGHAESGQGVYWNEDGKSVLLPPRGFNHFREDT